MYGCWNSVDKWEVKFWLWVVMKETRYEVVFFHTSFFFFWFTFTRLGGSGVIESKANPIQLRSAKWFKYHIQYFKQFILWNGLQNALFFSHKTKPLLLSISIPLCQTSYHTHYTLIQAVLFHPASRMQLFIKTPKTHSFCCWPEKAFFFPHPKQRSSSSHFPPHTIYNTFPQHLLDP